MSLFLKDGQRVITQDERWLQQWQTIMDFMEANKRRPSKFVDEERGMDGVMELRKAASPDLRSHESKDLRIITL